VFFDVVFSLIAYWPTERTYRPGHHQSSGVCGYHSFQSCSYNSG